MAPPDYRLRFPLLLLLSALAAGACHRKRTPPPTPAAATVPSVQSPSARTPPRPSTNEAALTGDRPVQGPSKVPAVLSGPPTGHAAHSHHTPHPTATVAINEAALPAIASQS